MRRLVIIVALLATVGCGKAAPDDDATPSSSPRPSPSETGSATPAAPSSGGKVDDQAPTTAAEARASIDTAAKGIATPLDAPAFVTPGGIYCTLGDDGVVPPSCEPPEPSVEDATYCAEAATTMIGRVELDAGVPNPVCNSDTVRTDDAATLPYGQTTPATGHPMQCLSQEIGVTCLDTGGTGTRGFFVGRDGFRLLD